MDVAVPTTRPKFKNPPVVEVAATLFFQELEPRVLALSVSDLLAALGSDYKTVEFKHEFQDRQGISVEQITNESKFEYARYWFESEDKVDLLQISHRRIGFNWRRLKSDDNNRYKTYEHVAKKFNEGLDALDKISSSKNAGIIKPVSMELAYFNHIGFDALKGSLRNISQLFPQFDWFSKASWLKEPNAFNFAWNVPDPEAKRNIVIQCMTAADLSTGEPLLRLEIVVKGNVANENKVLDREMIAKWFEEAHLIIVNTFTAITGDVVRKEMWGNE